MPSDDDAVVKIVGLSVTMGFYVEVKKALLPFVPPPLRVSLSDLALIFDPAHIMTAAGAVRTVLTLHTVLALAAFAVAAHYQSHNLFLIFAGFYLVWTNLSSGEGGVSAYSVFNRGLQRLAGTFHAEQVEHMMRTGGQGVGGRGANVLGVGAAGGTLPDDVVIAAVKWLTSHDMTKRRLRPGRDDVQIDVRDRRDAALAEVRALPQDTFVELCRRHGIDPFLDRKRAELSLVVLLRPEHYVNERTEPLLEGYGLR